MLVKVVTPTPMPQSLGVEPFSFKRIVATGIESEKTTLTLFKINVSASRYKPNLRIRTLGDSNPTYT